MVFWTQKRIPKHYQRCCSCASSWGCCYQIFNVLRLCRFSTDRYETFHTCQRQYSALYIAEAAAAAAAASRTCSAAAWLSRTTPSEYEMRVFGSDGYTLLFFFITTFFLTAGFSALSESTFSLNVFKQDNLKTHGCISVQFTRSVPICLGLKIKF